MLSRIFPKQIDNNYRGHWLAIGLFTLFVLLKLVMSTNSVVMTRSVATGADGLPLDNFTGGGAEAVISLFALLGLSQLVLALLGVVVLIRYRAMLPLMYLLMLIVQIGSRVLLMVNPIVRSGGMTIGSSGLSIGFAINLGLLAILLIGFVLSLVQRKA
jgi:hypothetical protein